MKIKLTRPHRDLGEVGTEVEVDAVVGNRLVCEGRAIATQHDTVSKYPRVIPTPAPPKPVKARADTPAGKRKRTTT